MAISQYILLCSEILISVMHHMLEFLAGRRCLRPDGWLHTYEMDMGNFTNQNLSVVVDWSVAVKVFTETMTWMTRFLSVY